MIDGLLAELVRAVNLGTFSQHITLYVGGAIVTGQMVPDESYVVTAQGINPSWFVVIQDARDRLGAMNNDDHPELPRHIHLRDAQWLMHSGQLIHIPWLRLKLIAVDAWSVSASHSPAS